MEKYDFRREYINPSDAQVWNVALASRRSHDERRRAYALAKRLDRENFGVMMGGESALLPRRIRSSPRLAMQVRLFFLSSGWPGGEVKCKA